MERRTRGTALQFRNPRGNGAVYIGKVGRFARTQIGRDLPGVLLVVFSVDGLDVDLLVLWDHLVLQVPARKPAEFRDDHVTIPEKIDIEINVTNGLRISANTNGA